MLCSQISIKNIAEAKAVLVYDKIEVSFLIIFFSTFWIAPRLGSKHDKLGWQQTNHPHWLIEIAELCSILQPLDFAQSVSSYQARSESKLFLSRSYLPSRKGQTTRNCTKSFVVLCLAQKIKNCGLFYPLPTCTTLICGWNSGCISRL